MKAIINLAQNILYCASEDHKNSHNELLKISKSVESNLQLITQTVDFCKERINGHTDQLKNGTDEFKDISKRIARLDKNVALLAQKAKDRRNNFENDDEE